MSVDRVVNRFNKMEADRGTWNQHWQEIGELMFPHHPTFIGAETKGTKKALRMYDATPVHASEMLAAGLHGFLTNPASQWFSLSLDDESLANRRDVKVWLTQVQDIMYKEMQNAQSAFSSHIHEMYLEYGTFGTGIMFIGENMDKDGLLFQAPPLSACYIDENEDGRVDTLYRLIPYTVKQVFERWGDAASEKTQKAYADKKFDDLVEVIHAVEPSGKAPLRFNSFYVERSQKHMLQNGGYKTFPFAVPRFYKASGEKYGRGPGVTALPDVKMLNEMMKTTIKAAQKIVDPPLQAPDDGFIQPIRTIPGGINYFRRGTGDRIEPLVTNGNIPISLEMMEELRMRIKQIFFVDLLELPHKNERYTATEIMQRTEDKMRVLGPVLGRMESEALNTIVQRVFVVLFEQNKFPAPPANIEDAELRIEYTSPIARAQKQLEAGGLQRVLEVMNPFIAADPTLLQKFDADDILDVMSQLFGLRPTFIKDIDQRQSDEEQHNAMMGAAQGAEVLKTGTEAGLNLKELIGGVGPQSSVQ